MKNQSRWLLVAGGVLAAGIGGAIAVRVQTWPCRQWARKIDCVSEVQLDIQDLDFIPGTAWPSQKAFDLSSGADTVLVGLEGFRDIPDEEGRLHVAVLALFDTGNGDMIRILREIEGEPQPEHSHSDRFYYDSSIEAAALSPDGQFAASYGQRALGSGDSDGSLIVQRTSDGELVHQFFHSAPHQTGDECYGGLDFSPDNQMLQCSRTFYQIGDDEGTILPANVESPLPPLSDYSSLSSARALDGTAIWQYAISRPDEEDIPLPPTLDLFDSTYSVYMFAPDSSMLIEAELAYKEARGRRRFLPPPFRRLSAITVRSAEGGEIQQAFFTNNRFGGVAWSRDSQYFAVINRNLSMQVFRAPRLSNE